MKRTIGQKIGDAMIGKENEDYINGLSDKNYDSLFWKLTIINVFLITTLTGLIYFIGHIQNQ
jgi:hypothetical protein